MLIDEVTWRNRNDFHWIGKCEYCGHRERYGDGYANHFYCLQVVPARKCPKCNLSSNEDTIDD